MSDQERRQSWMEVRRRIKAPLYPDWPEALPIKYVVQLDLERNQKGLREALEWMVVQTEKLPVQIRLDGEVYYGTFSEYQHHKPDSASVPIDDLIVTAKDVYDIFKDTRLEGYLRTWLEPYLSAATSSTPASTPIVSSPELIAQAPEKTVAAAMQPRVTRTEKTNKRPTKLEQFDDLLSRIEQAWLSSGRSPIDRKDWPGTSKALCYLAKRLLPESFGKADLDSFYRNYSKKMELRFRGDQKIGDIYDELFPDAPLSARLTDAA